jgi:hypothetical protein
MSGLALTTPPPAKTANPELVELTDRARGLARNINKNVGRILARLQIGDISRQRALHVQAGLAILAGLTPPDGGRPSASQLKLKAAGEMLLAAQLEAALQDYSAEVFKLIPSIEGLASDALALLALSDVVTELGDGGDGLLDLKHRMDAAVQLVAEIQTADGAARYLAGQLTHNTGVDAAQPASQRHPLDQKASELLDRIVYLEAATDDCIVILERLREASEALITESAAKAPSPASTPELQEGFAAAQTIRAIRDKAESDMAAHAGKNTDIFRLLDRGANPAISHEPHAGLEAGRYSDLKMTSPDMTLYNDALRAELSALLSKIEGLYAMGQERDVHRAFAKACGLQVAEETLAMDDGLF